MSESVTLVALTKTGRPGEVEAIVEAAGRSWTCRLWKEVRDDITSLDGDKSFWDFASHHVNESAALCRTVFESLEGTNVSVPTTLTG